MHACQTARCEACWPRFRCGQVPAPPHVPRPSSPAPPSPPLLPAACCPLPWRRCCCCAHGRRRRCRPAWQSMLGRWCCARWYCRCAYCTSSNATRGAASTAGRARRTPRRLAGREGSGRRVERRRRWAPGCGETWQRRAADPCRGRWLGSQRNPSLSQGCGCWMSTTSPAWSGVWQLLCTLRLANINAAGMPRLGVAALDLPCTHCPPVNQSIVQTTHRLVCTG